MSGRELQEQFVTFLQLGIPETEVISRPDSDTIFYFINKASRQLVESVYTGKTYNREGAEGTKFNAGILAPLVENASISVTSGSDIPNSFIAMLPSDLMYVLLEEVDIELQNLKGETLSKREGITEVTSDTYNSHISNPYSEHVLHYEIARPLRLFSDNTSVLITDGTYDITTYHLRYYKDLTEIQVDSLESDIDLPSYTHQSLVEMALSLYLRNIGIRGYSNESEQSDNNN